MAHNLKLKKSLPIILLIVSACIFIGIVRGNLWYVEKFGEFTIAKKVGISTGSKSGATSDYKYMFKNKTYHFSITDIGRGANYIYIKILLNHPGNEAVLTNVVVPDCLRNDSAIGHTWKVMPVCPIK